MTLSQLTRLPPNVAGRQRVVDGDICWIFGIFLSYCKVFISHFERQFRLGKTLLICQQKSVMFIYRIGSKTLGRLSTPGIGPGPPTCSPWILCTAEGSVFPKRRDGRIVKTCFVHVIPLSGTCFDMTPKRATRQSQTLNKKSIAMHKTGRATFGRKEKKQLLQTKNV